MKNKPQYNDEDVKALEHVSMLIDEYMCCDDDKLTESGKALKELVEDFFSQWEGMIEKYVFNEKIPQTPMEFIKTLEDAHEATKGSILQFGT